MDGPGESDALNQPVEARFSRRNNAWLRDRQTLQMVGLAVVVGATVALAAVLLWRLLFALEALFFGELPRLLGLLGPLHLVLIPAIGGVLVGLMVVFLAQEARGAGVSDVVLAVRFRGSRMKARVAAVKVVATSIAIGSGGSAGIEGPIIQVGSALGSGIGRRLRLSEEGLRITLASGAAAGIAATFNTPLAGVFFALEVILVDFSTRSFGAVVLAAVVANVVSRSLLGETAIFTVPPHALVHPVELLLYLLLGVLAAGAGLAFAFLLDRVEAAFTGWAFPNYLKPAVGGLAVGAIALAFPQVLGLGYGTIDAALGDRLPFALMGALVLVKMVATVLTVGSGSSGGVIGPSLYLGTVLGGTVGAIYHALLPDYTATAGAYALVGMGAVFAATAQAPITAIFTVFELSGEYDIILPLMVACVTAAYLAQRVTPHTIYSLGLRRRGIDIQTGRVGLPPMSGIMFLTLEVEPGSWAAGRQVKELPLPGNCLLISVRRGDRVMLPRGDTTLQPGDGIVASCAPGCETALREMVSNR